MLYLQNISYIHPNKDLLFDAVNLTVNHQDKIALIGNNGVGKSTLFKIIAGELKPSSGQLKVEVDPYYVPQIFGQYNHLTIAQALGVEDKFCALNEILDGNVTEDSLGTLEDDWTIEERCLDALRYWRLNNFALTQKIGTLSGGQKTKVFLAGILIHKPELVLLDEPSNHLDTSGRQQLYEFISATSSALVVVSHDRKLLNQLSTMCELTNHGISIYGGNCDFYAGQKKIQHHALNQDIHSKERALRKAKEKERETMERQQKLDSRGKGKQEKAGVARIMMNTLRNNAELSTSRVKGVHAEKVSGISKELHELRSILPDLDKMRFGFNNSALHKGKVIFKASDINISFSEQPLWNRNLSMEIKNGERIALKGLNGSGKTTLIKILLGKLEPMTGTMYRSENKSVYIDQDYSLLDKTLQVYEQAQRFNTGGMMEHEVKIRLNRFLFSKEDWDKPCNALSGGESMRLMLCCLTINHQSPDIIILDEPTNNLDIQNIEILTAAINEYRGSLLVISHDEYFLEQLNVERIIKLE